MTAGRVTLRAGAASVRVETRAAAVLVVAVLATAAAFTFALSRGEYPIAAGDVLAALAGGGDQATSFIVMDLRLPRALTGLLAGAALGIAGGIYQDVARNPLVSPDIIGITFGASLMAVTLIVLGDGSGTYAVPLAALAGALGAGAALYGLAWRGGVEGYRMVLIGVGLTALFQAGVSYVLTRGQILEAQQAYIWLVGSLNGRGWEHVWPLVVTLIVLAPVALALGRQLSARQLGDDVARALGLGVERTRLALLAVATALTAIAVAAAGPLAFVAFVAPHIARRLCRTTSPAAMLPVAACGGALLVVVADVAGREPFAPTEIPVGIVTAIIAAPYFLYLLGRTNRKGVAA